MRFICSTVPLLLEDTFGDEFISHRFADEDCGDAFAVLCRRHLQEDTSAPVSALIQLADGQGAGNVCIDGNSEKKFSIEMFGAIAVILASGLLITFFFLRNERLEVEKLRKREAVLEVLADNESFQSEKGNETQKQQLKPAEQGENQQV